MLRKKKLISNDYIQYDSTYTIFSKRQDYRHGEQIGEEMGEISEGGKKIQTK